VRDATETAELVRSGRASAAEVAREHLDRLPGLDWEIGSVWLVTEERAVAEAAAVDRRLAAGDDPGPLAGVPVGWKDLIETAGIRTTYGSAIWRDNVPEHDADVVARLAAAGALTIAKLATHELAWGTTTDNPWFGTCRNPHDTSRVPGGSSGGSAAALAADGGESAAGRQARLDRALLRRHLLHTDLAGRLCRSGPVLDAGLRAAAADQRLFDDLVELGLGTGRITTTLTHGLLRAGPGALARRRSSTDHTEETSQCAS